MLYHSRGNHGSEQWGIARRNINILHTQKLPEASISQTGFGKVHERQTSKQLLGVSRRGSQ